jgi:HEAT repeat protein
MGPVAEKAVLQCLGHPNTEVRAQAWRILGQIATKQSVPALLQLLQQNNKEVAKQVLPILARLKDERAMAAVGELLGNKDLRFAAIQFFQEMGPAAEKTVLTYAKHANEEVVAAAMEILQQIGTAECVPVVLEVAAGDNFAARLNAFRILERLKDPRSIVPLAEMLADPMVRHSAAQVLKKMGPAAEDVAIKGLKHPKRDVGMACLEILGEIGTEKSLKEIQPYTRVRDAFVRMAAARAMEAIASRTQANPFKEAEEQDEEK